MDSFFTRKEKLQVSSDFWIFLAVTIPVTAAVLLTWMSWIQREEIKKLLTDKKYAEVLRLNIFKRFSLFQRKNRVSDADIDKGGTRV
jgi:hypothetical protein